MVKHNLDQRVKNYLPETHILTVMRVHKQNMQGQELYISLPTPLIPDTWRLSPRMHSST